MRADAAINEPHHTVARDGFCRSPVRVRRASGRAAGGDPQAVPRRGAEVRAGIASADARIAWAFHVDHVVTGAAGQAASRAIELALSLDGGQPVSFYELVREEQRKLLRLVPVARR